jgi:hypothetical protein
MRFGRRLRGYGRIEGEGAYQKCTVLGPMGLFQKRAKPEGSAPAAVFTPRRAFARWKKGRKVLKMREPGRNDMTANFSFALLFQLEAGVRETGSGRGRESNGSVVCALVAMSARVLEKVKLGNTMGLLRLVRLFPVRRAFESFTSARLRRWRASDGNTN